MSKKPLEPCRDPVPVGFADAVGMDDASIKVVPRMIGKRKADPVGPAPNRLLDRAAAMGK